MLLALLGTETGALPVGTAALLPREIQLLPYGLILTTPEGCWPRETRHSHSTGDAAQHTLPQFAPKTRGRCAPAQSSVS